jgi:ribosomal protein S3
MKCDHSTLLILLQLDVAVEVIGERSMRIEELEADLVDMREIFKTQLEEAMAQVADLRAKLQAAGIATES